MKKIKLGKNALVWSIMTLITVLTWIGFEVYWAATKTTIPQVTQEQLASLSPRISQETIEKLKDNLVFSEEEFNLIDFSSFTSTESALTE